MSRRGKNWSPENAKARERIGKRVRYYREARGKSPQAFSEEIGITVATLGRIERGENEAGVVTLLHMARALQVGIELLVPKLVTDQEREDAQADKLWAELGIEKLYPETEGADPRYRRAFLETIHKWQAPGEAGLAHPYERSGLIGELRNKGSINTVLANLPSTTRRVRILAFSGLQSLEGESAALAQLEKLVRAGRTKVELLLLSPKSEYFHKLRSEEIRGYRSASEIGKRVSTSIDRLKNQLVAADKKKNLVRCLVYDRKPVWRLVFIDRKVYATFFPLTEGSQSPVLIFEADEEYQSFYWACHRVWFDYLRFPCQDLPKEHRGRVIPAPTLYQEEIADAKEIMQQG